MAKHVTFIVRDLKTKAMLRTKTVRLAALGIGPQTDIGTRFRLVDKAHKAWLKEEFDMDFVIHEGPTPPKADEEEG